MSRKNQSEPRAASVFLNLWQIAVFWDLNFSRLASKFDPDATKTKDLRMSLSRHGVLKDKVLYVIPISADLAKQWVAEMQQKLVNLEALFNAAQTPENEHALKVTRYLFCDEEGKVKTPEYRVIAGHNRVLATPYAMIDRALENQSFEYESFIGQVEWPCIIEPGDMSVAQIAIRQALENEVNVLGVNETSIEDKFLNVCIMVENGATESQARSSYKDGTGRKLFWAATLNSLFPALEIKSRVAGKLSENSQTNFSVSKIDLKEGRLVHVQTDPDLLAKENLSRQAEGKEPLPPMGEAEVFAWMERLMKRGGGVTVTVNQPKRMSDDQVAAGAKTHSNMVVRATMKAVKEGKTESLEPIVRVNDAVNAVVTIGPSETLGAALTHLAALGDTPERLECINRISSLVSEYQIPATQTAETPVTTEV